MSEKRKAEENGGVAAKKANTSVLFTERFDGLVKDVIETLPEGVPQEAKDYVKKMCDYTCKGGKMTRGITVVETVEGVAESKGETVSAELLNQAQVVGWCIEWLQACFLVLDDIMDESLTRRSQPCWYKLPEVGKMAINDGLILEACIYSLLKKHCKSHPHYLNIIELFHEVSLQTEMGQLLDMSTESPEGKMDFSRFTMQRYKDIVKFKTAFYSFYLPVASGLILSGVTDEAALTESREILIAMGEYFQIQDDVLDCYADPETLGKIGTDIQDKKCSWLCVTALGKVNKEQMKTLEDNYGVWDDTKVANIKALYKELQLKEAFDTYEEESYQAIKKHIAAAKKVPHGVFEGFLAKIYKRKY